MSEPKSFDLKSLLSKENITLVLAGFAAVLALAPYVLPQVQTYIVRHALVAHPTIIMEAQSAFDQQKEAESKQKIKAVLLKNPNGLISDNDPILGNAQSPITVVEFEDYFCGYCKAMSPHIEALVKNNPDLHFVIKEYPVIAGDKSSLLAALALSVPKDKYADIHHLFYSRPITNETQLVAAIKSLNLDITTLMNKVKSSDIQSQLQKNIVLGDSLGIKGTPFFIINGEIIDGAKSDDLDAAIKAARARVK